MAGMGLVYGWLSMTVVSLTLSAYLFWRYDRDGIDWLFANKVKKLEESATESSGRFRKLFIRVSRSKNGLLGIVTFVLASITIDPLIVAVHYRNNHFKGINLRDWALLILSVATANLWWGGRIWILVILGKQILR